MKEAALIVIKPDCIAKGIVGDVFKKFDLANLEMVAIRLTKITRELAEEHYRHIKGEPFFEGVINYIMGNYHNEDKVIAFVLYGNDAIKKCRRIAGGTNPETASPKSLRGAYGRITTKGVFENVVHVSSDPQEARREIKMWFSPDEILVNLYPVQIKTIRGGKTRVWK